ncbi:MAG: response regulator [Candidatus Obscuribacterales bacterium]|nr:response regulator [Candidatus Obscuribacterales bacterium]
MSEQNNYILVIDDDKSFRDLVGDLLKSRGYEVVLARSAKEATAAMEAKRPELAIVDYRLPEVDGMTWITQVRENDDTLPIVLCTGNWCDQKTFNWLRNILKVSQVIQKPIVPELFLHTLENIVPPPTDARAPEAEEISGSFKIQPVLNSSAMEESLEQIEKMLAAEDTFPDEVERLNKLKRRLETQNAIKKARSAFINTLPEAWSEITSAVKKARENPKNLRLLQDAMGVAHKLKGTAGSYGFSKVGQFAERIEDFLIAVDPHTDTEQEVIWAEVIRCVTEGTQIVDAIAREQGGEDQVQKLPSISCLAVTPDGAYPGPLKGAAQDANCELEMVGSAVGAIVKFGKHKYDSALIDLALDTTAGRFQLARELRQAARRNIPLCFINSKEESFTQADIVYGGASVLLDGDATRGGLSEAMQIMTIAGQMRKPRVLCVDDDPLLSGFVESVLIPAGIKVHSLNEPVVILDTMNDFQPDLILLDVIMPGLTGYEVCRLLKSHDEWKQVPVIFLTSKSDSEGKRAAFTAGGTDFLSKPVLVDELLARVKAHLSKTLSEVSTRIDPQSKVLTANALESESEQLINLCRQQSQSLALGAISIVDYEELDTMHGAFSAEHVVGKLGELLNERLRAEDLRGRLEDGKFAIVLAGETSETMARVFELFKEDWEKMWFPSARGNEFQTALAFSSAEFPLEGDNFEKLKDYALSCLKGRSVLS